MTGQKVFVVPHTHWDREWYQPFESFLLRLVDTLDELLDLMERDPAYRRFLLDGQMAMVDDYLAVRPENEDRIRALARAGRLSVGPWYVLMDEFLVSGETIVRNLQLGMARAGAFGGTMRIGYLPDMFGHIAQMPQILRLAGIGHAVVWRGVPSEIARHAFQWSAPDGSAVRAEYLPFGYGNGVAIADNAKELIQRLVAHAAELESFRLPGDGILFMNGSDHQPPQRWLGKVVAEANGFQDDFDIRIVSIAEVLDSGPGADLPSWRGELRSGARANLLMGVASNRLDVRQAAARAERRLERYAEPLAALFLAPPAWPGTALDAAWRNLILNAAHDSVCACSVDEVVDAVRVRYAAARAIAEGITLRAFGAFAKSLSVEGPVVLNPVARARDGLVELLLPGTDSVPGAQELHVHGGMFSAMDLVFSAAEARVLLGQLGSVAIDEHTFVTRVDVSTAAAEGDASRDSIDVVLFIGPEINPDFSLEEVKRKVAGLLDAMHEPVVRVRLDQPSIRRVLVRAERVPGFGWSAWSPGPPQAKPVTVERAAQHKHGLVISNGLTTVALDGTDGTFSLNGVAGFNRIEDGGDAGDTYNFSPPEHDRIVSEPDAVEVDVVEEGPLRALVDIHRTYHWPEVIDDTTKSRTGERKVVVSSRIDVRSGEHAVRIRTSFDNACRDHRVRALFALPVPATASEAECAFAVVTRGLVAEGGAYERGIPTFPSRRFVRAGGLTVVHDGLLEYELVDIDEGSGTPVARSLALTLLRATGLLSRMTSSYRVMGAGPAIPTPAAQMIGPIVTDYAVCTGGCDPHALADDVLVPLVALTGSGAGERPPTGCALEVTGAEVSAVRRAPGGLEVRAFNPRPEPASVRFGGDGGWIVDLLGDPVERFEDALTLRPFGIATVLLDGGGNG